MKFVYKNDPLNGVFRSFINRKKPFIYLEPSSELSNDHKATNIFKLDDFKNHWASAFEEGQWIIVFFIGSKFHLTGYSLRSYYSDTNEYQLSNWNLHTSNDNQTWFSIDSVSNETILHTKEAVYFPVNSYGYHSMFRFSMNGPTPVADYCMRISAIDFFGEIQDLICTNQKNNRNFIFKNIEHLIFAIVTFIK